MKKTKLKYLLTVRQKSDFIQGMVIVIFFITIPFLYYLYEHFPGNGIKIFQTKYFSLTSGGFRSVQSFVYHSWTKILIIISFSIWFFTSNNWWRFSLLVPISMYTYQLAGVLNQKTSYFDEFSVLESLFIVVPVIILHLIAAYKFNFLQNKKNALDLLDKELEDSINKKLN
ncbi:hypothetical protein [Algibacter sp. PT7-4]|uniref:hypothetical protein n=1 Tax=Algibacter ulvanivorans TaxID=3400999 RepID=UPI003AAEC962